MGSEITIKKISHLSGFSKSTVSKALNNSKEISDKTKRKIKKLAKNYNYVPNNSAKALRSKKTKIIAVIVPQIASFFFSKLISVIQELAFKKGYRIVIMESLFCEEKELECVNRIKDGCVDGLIIISTFQQTKDGLSNSSTLTENFILPTVVQIFNEFSIDERGNKLKAVTSFIRLTDIIDNKKNSN